MLGRFKNSFPGLMQPGPLVGCDGATDPYAGGATRLSAVKSVEADHRLLLQHRQGPRSHPRLPGDDPASVRDRPRAVHVQAQGAGRKADGGRASPCRDRATRIAEALLMTSQRVAGGACRWSGRALWRREATRARRAWSQRTSSIGLPCPEPRGRFAACAHTAPCVLQFLSFC